MAMITATAYGGGDSVLLRIYSLWVMNKNKIIQNRTKQEKVDSVLFGAIDKQGKQIQT